MKTIFRILVTVIGLTLLGISHVQAFGHAEEPSKITFYHHDALGSVIATSNEDGEMILSEEYQPYGEKIYQAADSSGGNEDWFTGKNYSQELDLTYFGARWYDAKQGRFLSMDPVPVSITSIHSFNRYVYAINNPYKYIDPDGLAEVFAQDGRFISAFNPQDDNVYARSHSGDVSLNISINDFHTISATVYGEGPPSGRTAAESTATANVIKNQGDMRGETFVQSATSSRFFGKNNSAARDYLARWRQGGKSEAPAARAGVISVLTGQPDPVGGRTMFEGSNLINSPVSSFKSQYIDTGVAYDPKEVGNTTYFREKTN